MMATHFYVEQRTDFHNGKAYGEAGPYELIVARTVTGAGEGQLRYLKPRDPAKGSGTMLFVLEKTANITMPEDPSLYEAGYIFAAMTWPDEKSRIAGLKEVMNFLRVTGGPMLLGDQPRFIKRAIVLDSGSWLPQFVSAGANKGDKDKRLFDGAWLVRAEPKPLPELKVFYSEAKGTPPSDPNVRAYGPVKDRKSNVALITALDAWIKDGKEPPPVR